MQNKNLILKLDSIVKVFPGVKALDGVHLDVKQGEVHALCGENGAGKSTLMKIISGAQSYTSGKMYMEEKEVKFHSTKDAENKGIAMIYQEFNMILDLSVAENMYLGRLPKTKMGKIDWKTLYNNAQEVLDKLGLAFNCKTKVKSLSVAETQMVEIAKCLTIGAKVIIMDEPTAALTDDEMRVLFAIIEDLKKKNISILYISHRMDEIFQISDRITVLRDGKYIATKNIGETDYDDVVSMMVGRSLDNLYPERNYIQKEVVLELQNINSKLIKKLSLELHKGEVLGIAGLIGSGTIELSKIIYGALPMNSGSILINGEIKDCSSPIKALAAGIGFVSDDRKQEGLVLIRNIKENISLSSLKKLTKGIHIDKKLEMQQINKHVKQLNIRISSVLQNTGNLSGGNQQKVVFAKLLEANPSIWILDEPTRGVDVGAKAEIYTIIDQLTKQGKSIILISTDLPELIGMSDRVLVMREGKIVIEFEKSKANQENILAYASGGVNGNE
ncbi:ribose ABC transporter (ATP-binding protein) [Petrocella atlantisensis]|uniref:Ribose ABC transporter (ATP-binding protein) n=1 Tax=Petrocella atlantisensis TaxID=2173034 RepID=A0A3P7S1H1_9FIRM|nr:sugar ABC transporter ATP-binding protein [Petrocella atlantisensis]VDN46749.1 ribose ABC transporter (ATP-binding protein) [Petrocella atlantisensis]